MKEFREFQSTERQFNAFGVELTFKVFKDDFKKETGRYFTENNILNTKCYSKAKEEANSEALVLAEKISAEFEKYAFRLPNSNIKKINHEIFSKHLTAILESLGVDREKVYVTLGSRYNQYVVKEAE